MKTMKTVVATACVLQLLVLMRVVGAQEYAYPYTDPYTATLTSVLLKSDGTDRAIKAGVTTNYVSVFEDREALVPEISGRKQLVFKLYKQKGEAPLVFVLGGLGANVFSGPSRYTADLLFKQGFHVIVLPSPFNWNFTLTASRSALPGITDEDAVDIYNAMKITLATAKAENTDLRVTRMGAVGFSLGALQLAYVSEVDRLEGSLALEKFLLINPPVDLVYALEQIDRLSELAKQWKPEYTERLISYAFGFAVDQLQRDIKSPGYFVDLDTRFKLKGDALKYLIGVAMELTLDSVVMVSELLNKRELVKNPVALNVQMSGVPNKPGKFSYGQYMNEILLPVWAQRLDTDEPLKELKNRVDLTPILDKLAANPEVYLLHNQDDFIVTAEHLEQIKSALGDRATIYPLGGHLGNLWYPPNKQRVRDIFAPLLDPNP